MLRLLKRFHFTDDCYNDADVRHITQPVWPVESVVLSQGSPHSSFVVTVLYRMRMVRLGHDPVNVVEIMSSVPPVTKCCSSFVCQHGDL